MKINKVSSSYKDPGGFVYYRHNRIFRQINKISREPYELLMKSGLYKKLTDREYLIPHKEVKASSFNPHAYKIIEPQIVPFISYSYEWSFNHLKDAALLTLKIQKMSLEYGLSLKDASSFNIQFAGGKPVLIDTLSFEKYREGEPWVAYKQFCEQFLCPLALSAYKDIRLNKLMQDTAGSIPLDLASVLLPSWAKVKPFILLHIILHSRNQKKYDNTLLKKGNYHRFGKQSFLGLLDSLESGIQNMSWKPQMSVWINYYDTNRTISYQAKSLDHKKTIVAKYLKILKPKTVWDIGSNTGIFSRIASGMGILTISMDNDPAVVEKNYLQMKNNIEKNILPLWIDILNPTPASGWENKERLSLLARPHPETVMALAFVHHLVLGNNLPLSRIASFFAGICRSLIIEFVPGDDPMAKILLQNREYIFTDYTQANFENEFGKYFRIREKSSVAGTKRIIYLMVKNQS